MNQKQEKDIIRTLAKAGNENLAQAFARSRGYTVATDWWSAGNNWLQKEAMKEYRAQLARHLKKRKKSTFRYVVPEWQADAIRYLGENDEEAFKALKLQRIG